MISRKAAAVIAAAVVTASIASLAALFALPVPAGVGAVALLAAGVAVWARVVVPVTPLLGGAERRERQRIVGLVYAAAVVHVAWTVPMLTRPQWWPVWWLALAGVAALEYWAALSYEHLLHAWSQARHTPQGPLALPSGTAAATAIEPAPVPEMVRVARRALDRAGYADVAVLDWSTIGPEDKPTGVRYPVQVDGHTAGKRRNGRDKLGGEDIERIAIAFSRVLGVQLESSWVSITKLPPAGLYSLTVTEVDTMATIYPYRDEPGLGTWSIEEPALIGYQVDGLPYYERLDAHWADTGKTRSGKTSLIHRKRARITGCYDATLWVCGTEKLFDSVGPWITPYRGTGRRAPFDAVAFGAEDSVAMLRAAMGLARWRQSVDHHLRGGFKTLIVEIDEASFLLALDEASEVVLELVKGAGSAGVFVHLAAQRGTNNNWGVHGGDINANLMAQTVFQTGDDGEIGRATGDWKLPPPRHKGEFLLNPAEGPVVRLKGAYINETDPKKRRPSHDGPDLSEVAWARRDLDHGLDPESEQAVRRISQWYRGRPTGADELYEYLTGTVPAPVERSSSAFEQGVAMAQAALDELLGDLDGGHDEDDLPGFPAPTGQAQDGSVPPAGESVADLDSRRTWRERVLDVVRSAEQPLSPLDIAARLGVEDPTQRQVVTNTLTALRRSGELHQPDRGLYQAAN